MNYNRVLVFLCLCVSSITNSQTISSKIVNKKTNEPVPYATIQLSENTGIITNEEGRFSLNLAETPTQTDSIYISSMGYEKVGVAIQSITDSIIYIAPKAIELKSVFVTNKNLTIDEIMDNVKDRISQNYNFDLSKRRLFFRESEYNMAKRFNVKFKKSTIKELTKKLIDSTIAVLPKRAEYYTEILGDLYGNTEKSKLHIIKAAELYDKSKRVSVEAAAEQMETIFKKNVRPDSYLKIKSGLFGTKVQVDSILEHTDNGTAVKDEFENQKKKGDKNDFLKNRKSGLESLFSSLFYHKDVMSNFLNKSGRYNFELVDYTTIDEASVYIITFSPKRKEDFKGTLYVNTEDFAVIRADYKNVRLLKNFGLLGVKFQDNLYDNTLIFSKGRNNKYDLKFLEMRRGNLFGFNRPLKVIEKNKHVKGRRKQNELSLDLDVIMTNLNKYEIVVFDSNPVSESEYTSSTENKSIKPSYLSRYNPEFWKGYNIIEPNSAIRQFTIAPDAETETTQE